MVNQIRQKFGCMDQVGLLNMEDPRGENTILLTQKIEQRHSLPV